MAFTIAAEAMAMLPVAMPVTGYRSDTANDGRNAERPHRIDGIF
jgi:hypothetical protein